MPFRLYVVSMVTNSEKKDINHLQHDSNKWNIYSSRYYSVDIYEQK
jgi:hypothetical protein